MRKIALAAIAAVCALGVSAQRASDSSEFTFWDGEQTEQKIIISPRVGLNVSNYSISVDGFEGGFDSKVGFSAGVSVEFPLVRSLYINSGLFYTVKGAEASYSDEYEISKTKFSAGYLELPVYASYRLNFAEESQLQLNFGPYFAYGLAGKTEQTYVDTEYGEVEKYKGDTFGKGEGKAGVKRFDFGLGLGLGYTFHKIYLGVNYQWGLVNINDDFDDNINVKNRNFNVSVGYTF